MHQTGAYVVLAGPDGSGKSTLARALLDVFRDGVPSMRHSHWRPGLLPSVGTLLRRKSDDDHSRPHAEVPHGRAASLALVLYYWVDFLIGTRIRWTPVLRRGGLIIVERGWWDYVIDPRRYRLTVSPTLIRVLGRMVPQPDLVLILQAKPDVLLARKRELEADELNRQTEGWRAMALPTQTRRVTLDASSKIDSVLEAATTSIREVMAARRSAQDA